MKKLLNVMSESAQVKKRREMCDILSSKLGNNVSPPKKAKPSATVSKPDLSIQNSNFPTINFDDIVDFVPIDNNISDFQLSDILKDIQNSDKNQQSVTNPAQTPTKNQLVRKQNDTPMTTMTPNQTHNAQVWNINQAQNNPFLPCMWFPNSSFTINYNFGTPPSKIKFVSHLYLNMKMHSFVFRHKL